MKYTLSVLVENQPGVLSKVVSLFARRGYNIDSLAVGTTEDTTMSRMTIVGQGDDHILEQVEKQLNKVIPVIKVRSLGPDAVTAELLLVKVACDPATLGKVNEIAALMKAEVADVSKSTVTLKYAGEHERCETLLDLLRRLAAEKGATPAQISLAWMLCKKPWIVPIPGTRKETRMKENAGAADVALSPGEVKALDDALDTMEMSAVFGGTSLPKR